MKGLKFFNTFVPNVLRTKQKQKLKEKKFFLEWSIRGDDDIREQRKISY